MIKIVYCLRRLPTLSAAQFSSYWAGAHAALVMRHAPTLGIVRYVQSLAIAPEANAMLQAQRKLLEPYDGVAEIYFDSLAALENGNLSEQAQAAQSELTADEDRFLDRTRSSLFIAEENPVIGRPTT